jgi:murein DD-endopeptidase MepM/ murein hydrolase activator NlpD
VLIHKGKNVYSMIRKEKFIKSLLILTVLITSVLLHRVTPVSAKSLQQEEPTYLVQQGDTLGSIALQFGVDINELQSINQIADPNALDIGQRLTIPGLEGIAGLLTSQTISFGDSLMTLTRAYQLEQDALITLNRLSSPTELIAGAKFIIPINEGEDPLAPSVGMPQDLTILETAIHLGTSPWILQRENQLNGSWDAIPGEILFTQSESESNTGNLATIDRVNVFPLPLVQGETTEISVLTNVEKQITGFLGEETLHFFTDEESIYTSFYGVHALANPGLIPLQISTIDSDGNKITYEQLVRVTSGGYGNEWVTVEDEYLDRDAISAEDAYVADFFQNLSPEKHWDGLFQYPVDDPCINSFFGQRRNYNNGAYYFYHTGMDFGVCAPNLNIYATAAGEVVMAEPLTVKGNAILIDHGWGVFSGYWHLSEFEVEVGDFVETGDLIGLIGNTGRSAGPHLHFEIDIHCTPINPQTWLSQSFPSFEP